MPKCFHNSQKQNCKNDNIIFVINYIEMKNTNLQITIPKWEKDPTITDKIIKIQHIPNWYYDPKVKII
jgi:hypothetical protein